MSTINSNTLAALNGTAAATASATTADKGNLGQDDFLKLMTEQLKAQDPMKPGDTGEFLGQMAQFASVSGIQSLQQTMSDLATSLQSTQALQASGMVGRTVLLPGDTASLGTSGGIEGVAEVPYGASAVNFSVIDARGATVHSGIIESTGGENASFSWDGTTRDGNRAAAGSYRVEVTAATGQGQVAVPTQIAGRVESVLLGSADGLTLNVAGLGKVPASHVTELR
ncbi:MAG: flagellar hook assembly protein FlgD [Gammaproteobacteria bacterium]|nr:flagellar hook assembly protein FlgD [Gammaproteobacteria bacterium]